MYLARELDPRSGKPRGDFWVYGNVDEALAKFPGESEGAIRSLGRVRAEQFGVWQVPDGTPLVVADCGETWRTEPVRIGRIPSVNIRQRRGR